MSSTEPKILISYTHDSPTHKKRVLELANKFWSEGVECHVDQYESSPAKGWPRWMDDQVEGSDFVLAVCTETYARRFRGHEEPGKGLGAQWEGFVITQELFDAAGSNTKFIPVIFSGDDAQYIPTPLRSATYYRVDLEEGYEDLYRRITAQPRVRKPPLGPRRVFDEFETPVADRSEMAAEPQHILPKPDAPIPPKRDLSDLTLLFLSDEKYAFVPSHRIEQGEEIVLELLPDDARKTAFLADIKNQQFRPEMAVAFRNTAIQAHVAKTITVHEGGREIWRLHLKPSQDNRYSAIMDFTFNDFTPEDIAEMKARRILLNERPEMSRGRRDLLSEGVVESMISREEGLIREVRSRMPDLFEMYGHDPEYFLEAARLMSVLYLRLTGVVEHIFRLELSMNGNKLVSVSFEGQRPSRYANQPSQVIKFEGDCPLS